MKYTEWLVKYQQALNQTIVSYKGETLEQEEGFDVLLKITSDIRDNGGTLFMGGNGASAAMASHYAVDFWKNGGVKASTFFDISQVTAISNDLSYDEIFSFPLSRFARKGDAFVGISSSGNSPNVVNAAKMAQEMGLITISFSGFKPDNRLRAASTLAFYVPADTYGFVESAHAAIMHVWIDKLLEMV